MKNSIINAHCFQNHVEHNTSSGAIAVFYVIF